jgi:hypothetical protein
VLLENELQQVPAPRRLLLKEDQVFYVATALLDGLKQSPNPELGGVEEGHEDLLGGTGHFLL